MDDRPHIQYLNLGPWPVFIGVTTSPKAFGKEMKRLGVPPQQFMGRTTASGTLHSLVSSAGDQTYILAIKNFKKSKVTRECYAALVAHEAMHVVQYMQIDIANGCSLGVEAEAYLIQQIVQETLQFAWKTGMVRRTEPLGDD